MNVQRMLIIGNGGEEHVGAYFLAAARQLKIEVRLLDLRESRSHFNTLNRVSHRLLGRRPFWLNRFSHQLIEVCRQFQPQLLLVTGISPPAEFALRKVVDLGIKRVNFLTDDPWNPRNSARFFWESLRKYDVVYTPRRSNLSDLKSFGCRRVEYLPFAYNPECHFPEPPSSPAEWAKFSSEVAIVGGADEDRIPLARACRQASLKLALYGGYWDRWPDLRPYYKGFVHGAELRKVISGAAVNVCMMRRANRDGHAMRSFELPAMAGCMVVEDTAEHRQIFGVDGVNVCYFKTAIEMVERTGFLLKDRILRGQLRAAAHRHIVNGGNTYADRLRTMLEIS